MKITKCKLKLIQTFVCWVFTKVFIKQSWPTKKSYITRFNWAWNSNFYEGQ